SRTCVGCIADSDCSALGKFCDPEDDTCQICYDDTHCSGNTPVCNTNMKICGNKCSSIGEFHYWDDTCGESCDLPLSAVIEGINKVCEHSCNSSQYLYWDSICRTECEKPFSARTTKEKLFCDFPCPGQDYYLYSNGNC